MKIPSAKAQTKPRGNAIKERARITITHEIVLDLDDFLESYVYDLQDDPQSWLSPWQEFLEGTKPWDDGRFVDFLVAAAGQGYSSVLDMLVEWELINLGDSTDVDVVVWTPGLAQESIL